LTSVPSDIHIQGVIKFSLYQRRKNSFKTRTMQEITSDGMLFRVRHEALFTTSTNINKKLYDQKDFQNKVINHLVPFASELFAILTSKSFRIPIVPPGEVRFSETPES
jgi:hypothetical protein